MGADVTIILTSYNRPKLVSRAIESVIGQDHDAWKLIIIDDLSNKITCKVIARYLHDERIAVYSSELKIEDSANTARFAFNINQALRLVTTPYVGYLTDDDFYYPGRLKEMLNVISHEGDYHVVYGGQRRIVLNRDGTIRNMDIARARDVLTNAWHIVDHNSVMHCTHCAEDVGLWPTDLTMAHHADGEFWRKLTTVGYLFYPVDIIGEEHYLHYAGIQRRTNFGENYNCNLRDVDQEFPGVDDSPEPEWPIDA